MFRKILVVALVVFSTSSGVYADGMGVRVLSFSQGKGDATGDALTAALLQAFESKGYAKPADVPEPALLMELKNANLVQGKSLDEVKGLDLGAGNLVTGSYQGKDGSLSVEARLIDVDSGEVLATTKQEGSAADVKALAGKVADALTASLAKPAPEGQVETVNVEVSATAPDRRVALTLAKRDAVEQGAGAVVDVKKVPEFKQVVAKTSSTLRYRIVSETTEGGKTTIKIAANVDIPAELAAKYPAPAKEIADETGFKPYIERTSKGEVDWEKGILRVVGRAKVGGGEAKAQLLARRAAVADAYARALEVVSGVRVNGDAKVSDAQKKDPSLSVKISGLVQGGKVVKENAKGADGRYEVTLEVPMRGLRGVQTLFLDGFGSPTPPAGESAKAEAADEEGEFTGIIIDARGSGMQAGLFPKILDDDGKVIADSAASDRDILKAKGQAAFVEGDPEKAGSLMPERLGPHPLIFKADLDLAATYQVASLLPMVVSQYAPKGPKGFRAVRQGPRPLKIKGLNTTGPTKVNLLVSTRQQDKAKFKQNLARLFGKCKVVVVMDSQIGGTEGRLPAPEAIQLSLR